MHDTELAIMVMSGPNDGQVIYLSQQQGHGTIEPDGTWMSNRIVTSHSSRRPSTSDQVPSGSIVPCPCCWLR